MSNYHALARHPITGEIRVADWLDDSFGHHIYGVRFPGDKAIYRRMHCIEVSLHEAGVEIERLRGIIAHNDAALAEVCAENERLWAALREIAGNGNATGQNPQMLCNVARAALEGRGNQ